MSKRVTIAEVAALAGVHKATVSRALGVATEGQVNRVTVARIRDHVILTGYDAKKLTQNDLDPQVLIDQVKSAAPASGYDEVLVANEPELRSERERMANGIPIPDGTWDALMKAAARVGQPRLTPGPVRP